MHIDHRNNDYDVVPVSNETFHKSIILISSLDIFQSINYIDKQIYKFSKTLSSYFH
jgi:hypothetical protein